MISLVFFGSFQSYSVQVLNALHQHKNFAVIAVITTPPRPGHRGLLQKTAVHLYCQKNNLPVFPLQDLKKIPTPINPPDFVLVAGYGQLLPPAWLKFPRFISLNLHASLLPHYPGRFPAEWAILRDENETGITLIKMNENFDQGEIIAQKKIPLTPQSKKEEVYQKLYQTGAELVIKELPKIKKGQCTFTAQATGKYFFARQLIRADGQIPWSFFQKHINQQKPQKNDLPLLAQELPHTNNLLSKMIRALSPWPGVWTITPNNKRLKILSLNPPLVQIEGKKPTPLNQIKNQLPLN